MINFRVDGDANLGSKGPVFTHLRAYGPWRALMKTQ
jgi:hypothetical protein